MSRLPDEKPSTAGLVSAGSAPTGASKNPEARAEQKKESMPSNVRRMERPARGESAREAAEWPGALVPEVEGSQLRQRWDTIQTGFVDEPRRAVEEADSLVAQTMKRVAEVFSEERARLEHQWSQGQDVSTEDLRVALKRYRSFFDRLLSV